MNSPTLLPPGSRPQRTLSKCAAILLVVTVGSSAALAQVSARVPVLEDGSNGYSNRETLNDDETESDLRGIFSPQSLSLANPLALSHLIMVPNRDGEQFVVEIPSEVGPHLSEVARKRENEPGLPFEEPNFPSHLEYDDLEWVVYGERRIVIISDSAMAGVRWNGATEALVGADYELYLESCRRLVTPSCSGREGYAPRTALKQIERLEKATNHRDVLVIATGYNDWEGRFASAGLGWDDLGAVMAAAREKHFKNIVWVTLRSDSDYRLPRDSRIRYADNAAMNEAVRTESSDRYPELAIWDLDLYTDIAIAEGYFYPDGVHEREIGSWLVADWISRHVASLDGRPCPQPWALGLEVAESCPNPDSLPRLQGFPDIAAIYGLPAPLDGDLPPLRSPV